MEFQSTHSRRVRHFSISLSFVFFLFQSTHSRRVRLFQLEVIPILHQVSIHALTKSATIRGALPTDLIMFQSTHSRRVRPLRMSLISNTWKFQSTHSRRVRLYVRIRNTHKSGFNPRTHEECDAVVPYLTDKTEVSIHALTKSATHYPYSIYLPRLFQSTHSRRVRPAPVLRMLIRNHKSVADQPYASVRIVIVCFRTPQ